MKKLALPIIYILIFFCLLILLQAQVQEIVSRATLVVSTTPDGAEVYVNKQLVGNTPLELELDAGITGQSEVEVGLRLDGYYSKRAKIKLVAGQRTEWIGVALEPSKADVPQPTQKRRITDEARIFNQAQVAVCQVFGDRGSGSGFLVDSSGLVVTNYHVISDSKYLRVQINEKVKVKAELLASDSGKDIAILRINDWIVKDVQPLPLASASATDPIVYIGEKVVAIGSPLTQTNILTSGIVSKVDDEAIISDVNINHGNSGGPMLNLMGEVVGINTFLIPNPNGPGISGSVLISEAFILIEEARSKADLSPPPSPELLPVMPEELFPLDALKSSVLVGNFDESLYTFSSGDFNFSVSTPPYDYFRVKRADLRLESVRMMRESQAGRTEQVKANFFSDLLNWLKQQDAYQPVVSFKVSPKVGQTGSSILLNALGRAASAYASTSFRASYTYEFKGDVDDFKLYRDGVLITDIERSVSFEPLVISSSTWSKEVNAYDIAQIGTFTYPIEVFRPEDGRFPNIVIEVDDLKKKAKGISSLNRVSVSPATIRRIWTDFIPYTGDHSTDEPEPRSSVEEGPPLLIKALGATGFVVVLFLFYQFSGL